MSKHIKIDKIFNLEKGTLQSSKNTEGDYIFVTAAEEWKTHNSYTHELEALIIAVAAEGSLGRTHYINDKFIASDLCFILTPKEEYVDKIDMEFYSYYFNNNKDELIRKLATGTSKKAINQTNFKNYTIPLYDLEDQLKAKSKIKQTFKLKDQLIELIVDTELYIKSLLNEM